MQGGTAGVGVEAVERGATIVAAITAALSAVLDASPQEFRITSVRPVGWLVDSGSEGDAEVWRLSGHLDAVFRKESGAGRRDV